MFWTGRFLESEQNSALFRKMRDELDHEYGGQDKYPWSAVVLKEAFKTCFKSSKASHKRVANGRRNRKDEKLARRLKNLNNASWSVEKVAKVAVHIILRGKRVG